MAINMSKRLTMDGSWDECFTPEPSQASGLPSTIRSNNIDAGLSATRNHFTPTSSLTSAPSLKTVQPHPDERTFLNAGTNSAASHRIMPAGRLWVDLLRKFAIPSLCIFILMFFFVAGSRLSEASQLLVQTSKLREIIHEKEQLLVEVEDLNYHIISKLDDTLTAENKRLQRSVDELEEENDELKKRLKTYDELLVNETRLEQENHDLKEENHDIKEFAKPVEHHRWYFGK